MGLVNLCTFSSGFEQQPLRKTYKRHYLLAPQNFNDHFSQHHPPIERNIIAQPIGNGPLFKAGFTRVKSAQKTVLAGTFYYGLARAVFCTDFMFESHLMRDYTSSNKR